MLICHCLAVSERTITASIVAGARTIAEITERCGAGGKCGGCHTALEELLDQLAAPHPGRADVDAAA